MKKSDLLERLLCSTILTGAVALGTPAFAQNVEASDDEIEMTDEAGSERMVITGSKLRGADLNVPNPVLEVGSFDIDARGTSLVEDLLNTLPPVFAGQTSEVANGASGTSTVNLRGLGAIRTLPLIDGKRLPFGSPNISAANVDLVPAQLVERIEIVTGTGSAVYGSDAVAGVVNFVLKDDFEGLEIDVQGGFHIDANDNDFAQNVLAAAGVDGINESSLNGYNTFVSATFGANTADGRGNVTAFFQYLRQGEIRQDSRDISACAFGANSGEQSFGGVGCVGSSTFRRFFSAGDTFQQADGTLVPFVGGPEQTFNFAPDNFFQRPIERFTLYTKARYDITDDIEGYLTASFQQNETDAQIAFSGTFFRPFEVNCGNPLLNQGLGPNGNGAGTFFDLLGCQTDDAGNVIEEDVSFVNGYRNVEGDPRNSRIETVTWRVVGGVRGDLFDDTVNWDLFAQFSRVNLTDVSTGDLNFSNVQDALFAVDDGNGNIVCRSGNTGCVPFDIFSRPGGQTAVTPEQIAYVQGTGITVGFTEQVVIGGTVQADGTKYGIVSPFHDAGVSVLGGFEFRGDTLDRQPDDISQIPGGRGLTGVGGGTLPVSGEVRVAEAFMEARIPLVQDFPLIYDLTVKGAYRRSMYTTDGNGVTNEFDTNSFDAGVLWTVVPDLQLRAQYQQAVRAPNVIELFTGQNTGLFDLSAGPNGLFDPCAGDFDPATPAPEPAASAAACANTGVTAEQFGTIVDNPAGQFNQVTGGNPELGPETSETITAGVVFEPRWVPDLRLTIDYFNITVSDAIATVPPTTSLTECLETGNPTFCNLIVRDTFGSLFLDNSNFEGIQAVNTNIAELSTDGFDFNLTYNYDLSRFGFGDFGNLAVNFFATYLQSLDTVPLPGEATIECAGFYAGDCGTPNPKFRKVTTFTWQSPYDIDVRLGWRYFGGVELDGTSSASIDPELETQQ
ncbi:MAG: TonB-dependent receptor domain-containing protein [Alphaproteobacteria bacterium]